MDKIEVSKVLRVLGCYICPVLCEAWHTYSSFVNEFLSIKSDFFGEVLEQPKYK